MCVDQDSFLCIWGNVLSCFVTTRRYSLQYVLYSAPNCVIAIVGGQLIDRLGTQRSLFIFVSLVTVGHAIYALGFSVSSYAVCLIGRIVFGLGGESLSVVGSTILAQWFKGREIAFAMGLNLSFIRLGSVANDKGTSSPS